MLVIISILFPMLFVSIFERKPFFNILDYINTVGIAFKQSVFNMLFNRFTFDLFSPNPSSVYEPFLSLNGIEAIYDGFLVFYLLMRRITTIGDKRAFKILARRYYFSLIFPLYLLMLFVELNGFRLIYPYLQYVVDIIVIVVVISMMKNGVSKLGIRKMRGRITDFYVFFVLGYLLLGLLGSKLLVHVFLLRLVSNEDLNLMLFEFYDIFITFIFYLSYVFFIIPLAEILFDERNHGASFF
jgi:hypothetical protein